ncbi:MAG: NAD(P)/FAD-dependent oxidoreductase [Lactobacillales bacterium]|jgi:predicted Rossmann fold flavoprotein|nr:NAD(P)/FAD-dependent oxidoreductase [Lactobacillales bacterium]
MKKQDIIIIGAGASGLMAAYAAARQDKNVLVLNNTLMPAQKVTISGGGKCNFSNRHMSSEKYVSHNPHFCKSALARYRPDDFIKLLEENNISWEERAGGKLFSVSGKEIAAMLIHRAQKAGAQIRTGVCVKSVHKEEAFYIQTDKGNFESDAVIVASGGTSFAKLGATSAGLKIAQDFGLNVIPVRPALTAFLFPDDLRDAYAALAGVSVCGQIFVQNKSFVGDILFTHKGISGPAVLTASLYWQAGGEIKIDFMPGVDHDTLLRGGKTFLSAVSSVLPKKLAAVLLAGKDRDIANATKLEKAEAMKTLRAFCYTPKGLEGYDKAEVMAGGVDTKHIDGATMQCRSVPGLYFCGEVLDVTGWLGGYNLHWAWASGTAAGLAAGKF